MGGYDPASSIPFYFNYLNHHPDQHNISFLPSDPDVMYQSNDGGVYKTMNDRDSVVVWQSLNNGYVTGQFYAIAIDHATANNSIVIGGVQDNGTWFTNNLSLTTPWTQPGSGDGAFCAIDNGHNYYYMSRQQGKTAKVQLDANGNVLNFRRMDPVGGSDYLFINPFVLDPNNNEVMYMAAGTKIFRNDSLSQIPLTGAWDTISTGWFQLPDTISQAATVVTAFAVAPSNSSKLYVGSSKRKVYRVDNANSFSPAMADITSTLFPGTGYVTCIAVDPAEDGAVATGQWPVVARAIGMLGSARSGGSFTEAEDGDHLATDQRHAERRSANPGDRRDRGYVRDLDGDVRRDECERTRLVLGPG
jgi:hypothetical protein